jgi:hypothetical protein
MMDHFKKCFMTRVDIGLTPDSYVNSSDKTLFKNEPS